MRRFTALFVPALLVSIAACGPKGAGGDDDDDDDGADARVDSNTGGPDGPSVAEACRKMDLIFVIDDYVSMSQEQSNLAQNFPAFANTLNTYTTTTGEQLDYRAAITTTGVTADVTFVTPPLPPPFPMIPPVHMPQDGDDGVFRQACGMTRRWLERTDPMMASTFACAANVGTNGPGLEMPLRASQLAVLAATNPGFLRTDALLGIVMITDEDDCSHSDTTFNSAGDGCTESTDMNLVTPQGFLQSMDAIKGERGRWAAAIIAGRTDCTSPGFGQAVEGIRLKAVAAASPDNVVFGDICMGDLDASLQQALDTFQAACESFPPPGKSTR